VNILFLSQRVPYPPDRGDRITTWNVLRHLLDSGHEVRVGALAEEDRDADAIAFLRERVAAVSAPRLSRRLAKVRSLRGLLTRQALTIPFFRNRELARDVDRWLEAAPPDVIYVYSSSMAQYALSPAAARACRIMQFAELDSDKWAQFARRAGSLPGRWIYGREARLLLAFEDRVARAFDHSLVVSEVERQLFRERIPGVDPVVVPNGVDVDHFRSAGDEGRDPHTVVFTGVMDYAPNVDGVLWFVREGWGRVRERFQDARLLIVGSKPVPEIRELDGTRGILVTGRVEEIPPWLDRAAVSIAPLRLARGVQNKVLEAMSTGLPVVSSPQAAQGIATEGGGAVGLRIADSMDAFVSEVCALLDDPARARDLGRSNATWVRENYRWEQVFEQIDALLQTRNGIAHRSATPADQGTG